MCGLPSSPELTEELKEYSGDTLRPLDSSLPRCSCGRMLKASWVSIKSRKKNRRLRRAKQHKIIFQSAHHITEHLWRPRWVGVSMHLGGDEEASFRRTSKQTSWMLLLGLFLCKPQLWSINYSGQICEIGTCFSQLVQLRAVTWEARKDHSQLMWN